MGQQGGKDGYEVGDGYGGCEGDEDGESRVLDAAAGKWPGIEKRKDIVAAQRHLPTTHGWRPTQFKRGRYLTSTTPPLERHLAFDRCLLSTSTRSSSRPAAVDRESRFVSMVFE